MYKKCSGNVVVFLVLYVDDILLIEYDVGGIIFDRGMVIQKIRYEGLVRSRSHPWDQAFARSQAKDVGLITSYIYR